MQHHFTSPDAIGNLSSASMHAFKPFEFDRSGTTASRAVRISRSVDAINWRAALRDHMQRVGAMSTIIAEAMGLSHRDAELVGHAARVHDIGKMFVPPKLHEKAGALTPTETRTMQSHAAWGFEALKASKDPLLVLAAEVALQHHEHWDGSGYPFGLAGEEIGLAARIVTVCDVYDSLRSRRSYKPAMSHHQAMSILTDGDHRTDPAIFDPAVLDAFICNQALCCEIVDQPRCAESLSIGLHSH
jgi:putative two-component system response regulator